MSPLHDFSAQALRVRPEMEFLLKGSKTRTAHHPRPEMTQKAGSRLGKGTPFYLLGSVGPPLRGMEGRREGGFPCQKEAAQL